MSKPWLSVVVLGCALAACAGRDELVRWEDVEVAHVTHVTPAPPAVPAPTAAPSSAPVVIEGLSVDAAGLVNVRALELACLADATALIDPPAVRARFDDVAGRQLVPVGELAFVLLARDPADSITDPPPQLCRTIASSTVLRAPLMRAQEPAGRWLVRRIAAGLVDDAAHLVRDAAALGHTAQPRVLIDDTGALVAVALPVAMAKD